MNQIDNQNDQIDYKTYEFDNKNDEIEVYDFQFTRGKIKKYFNK